MKQVTVSSQYMYIAGVYLSIWLGIGLGLASSNRYNVQNEKYNNHRISFLMIYNIMINQQFNYCLQVCGPNEGSKNVRRKN